MALENKSMLVRQLSDTQVIYGKLWNDLDKDWKIVNLINMFSHISENVLLAGKWAEDVFPHHLDMKIQNFGKGKILIWDFPADCLFSLSIIYWILINCRHVQLPEAEVRQSGLLAIKRHLDKIVYYLQHQQNGGKFIKILVN